MGKLASYIVLGLGIALGVWALGKQKMWSAMGKREKEDRILLLVLLGIAIALAILSLVGLS